MKKMGGKAPLGSLKSIAVDYYETSENLKHKKIYLPCPISTKKNTWNEGRNPVKKKFKEDTVRKVSTVTFKMAGEVILKKSIELEETYCAVKSPKKRDSVENTSESELSELTSNDIGPAAVQIGENVKLRKRGSPCSYKDNLLRLPTPKRLKVSSKSKLAGQFYRNSMDSDFLTLKNFESNYCIQNCETSTSCDTSDSFSSQSSRNSEDKKLSRRKRRKVSSKSKFNQQFIKNTNSNKSQPIMPESFSSLSSPSSEEEKIEHSSCLKLKPLAVPIHFTDNFVEEILKKTVSNDEDLKKVTDSLLNDIHFDSAHDCSNLWSVKQNFIEADMETSSEKLNSIISEESSVEKIKTEAEQIQDIAVLLEESVLDKELQLIIGTTAKSLIQNPYEECQEIYANYENDLNLINLVVLSNREAEYRRVNPLDQVSNAKEISLPIETTSSSFPALNCSETIMGDAKEGSSAADDNNIVSKECLFEIKTDVSKDHEMKDDKVDESDKNTGELTSKNYVSSSETSSTESIEPSKLSLKPLDVGASMDCKELNNGAVSHNTELSADGNTVSKQPTLLPTKIKVKNQTSPITTVVLNNKLKTSNGKLNIISLSSKNFIPCLVKNVKQGDKTITYLVPSSNKCNPVILKASDISNPIPMKKLSVTSSLSQNTLTKNSISKKILTTLNVRKEMEPKKQAGNSKESVQSANDPENCKKTNPLQSSFSEVHVKPLYAKLLNDSSMVNCSNVKKSSILTKLKPATNLAHRDNTKQVSLPVGKANLINFLNQNKLNSAKPENTSSSKEFLSPKSGTSNPKTINNYVIPKIKNDCMDSVIVSSSVITGISKPNLLETAKPTSFHSYCSGKKNSPKTVFKESIPVNQKTYADDKKYMNFADKKASPRLERRIVYVGDLPHDYSEDLLYERFKVFGKIEQIEMKNKELFAFITYKFHEDATKAIENGNRCEGPILQLNYGGRRQFVKEDYTDLDGKVAENEEVLNNHYVPFKGIKNEDDYALMLQQERKRRGLVSL